ncbi:MAG: FAD-dependent thymidylate synthase [Treponema sp.]|nr:FAD-dependent thymidylate synthase [Treponema sp.]
MAHCVVAGAEALLDKEYPVLDKGFVRLVDYLGGDQRVVQAARVSYGEGARAYREDAALIDYLLRHEHTSPFEQVILSFHVKLPVFVARQWIRHRTARVNEISGRYSVMRNEFYVPAPQDVAMQSRDNKQGRSAEVLGAEEAEAVRAVLETGQQDAYKDYSALVGQGLAKELARINLPLSLYTEWYWQIDLHNLFHFLKLRLDTHAQKEIRLYAGAIFDIAKKVAPCCCDSFERHVLGAVSFSREEFGELKSRLDRLGEALHREVRHREVRHGEAGEEKPADKTPALTGKALERFETKLETGVQW